MHLRQLQGEALIAGIGAALAGGPPVAPVCDPRLQQAVQPDQPVSEPDAALVVPTSGTTSEPKAVVLSASAIRFSATATHQRLGGVGDWVCALPVQHVAGLMTIARAVVGATSVSFARPDLSDLPAAGQRSYLSLVAAQLHRALGDPAQVDVLAGYAGVLVGGSAIRPELLAASRAAGIPVVATYGASETCGGCVYDGIALPGVRVELDGERIGLGGPMAFSGYRLRPDLTTAVLRKDLVLTSDRGRFRDSRLEVLGRIDDVVISGGEKVDLALAQRICEAEFGSAAEGGLVLLALPDQRWGQRVVAASTSGWELRQIQDLLLPKLGRAGIPKELRRIPVMAYTSLGKIDRVALRRAWEQKGEHGDIG